MHYPLTEQRRARGWLERQDPNWKTFRLWRRDLYIAAGDSFRADRPQLWSPGPVTELGRFTYTLDLRPDGKRFAVRKAPGTGRNPAVNKVNIALNSLEEWMHYVRSGKKDGNRCTGAFACAAFAHLTQPDCNPWPRNSPRQGPAARYTNPVERASRLLYGVRSQFVWE